VAQKLVPGIGLLLAVALAGSESARSSAQNVRSSIAAHLEAGDLSTISASTDLERARLAKLYERAAFSPMWIDAAGRRTERAREAMALLETADEDGLEPAHYTSGQLNDLATTLDIGRSPTMEQASQYELALSAAMLRYLDDVRHGVIDPRTLGIGLPAPADRDDVVTCLHGAVDRGRLGGAVECARPVMEEYRLLRAALKRHRTLAAALAASPPFTATLHPGDRFGGAARLRASLSALGDLPSAPSAPVNIGVYSGVLVEGVKHFQSRHGLDADGVIGRATWRELSVPPAHRARQIELALERLRWLPHQIDAALLVLNIPLFELRGWDHGWMGDPAFTMKAIVGRPVTPTPVMPGTMESVIFRPYWNVPRSILRQEFLPTLRKDPGLLVREDMEIVRGDGDDADVVTATAHNLDLLDRGRLRLRQRPGSKNALGFIKFVLPNEEYVYLHGTPAQRLFARSQRAFSHGCVRVEDPVALAEWVFAGSNEWNRERITETISTSTVISRKVRVPRRIQVLLVYTTAFATSDGSVRFAPDIYSQDESLDRALRDRR